MSLCRALRSSARTSRALLLALATAVLVVGHARATRAGADEGRVFQTPEAAVHALAAATKGGVLEDLLALFGAEGRDLASGSDPATARRHREVFVAAMAEGWRLVDQGPTTKELVIGNEGWPFPVPIVKVAGGWRFDAAAGREEILLRRIGRNELAVIDVCRTYVHAQRAYAAHGHDGKPAGLYARRFASHPGTQNGLYWQATPGARRSPLGDLVAKAATEGRQRGSAGTGPVPFHGYYFRILEGQGDAAPGGAASYLVDGELSGGFALVAWPAAYDDTGVMTFVVNHDGMVYEKDLGPDTAAEAARITRYDPDPTWTRVGGDATGAR